MFQHLRIYNLCLASFGEGNPVTSKIMLSKNVFDRFRTVLLISFNPRVGLLLYPKLGPRGALTQGYT